MYESFFHFHTRPFPCTPRIDLYFPAASIEHAHYTLARLIERAEGPGLLIGGPGTGKTLVCQMLEDRFRESFHVVMLNSAQLTTQRALLQHILFELELPYRGLDEGELLLSLMEFLQPGNAVKVGLLLLVDEAHTLPAPVLEGLRTITNVTRNGQPRVRLVLAGGSQLEERFAQPELDCFNQRLAARCYLQPLNYDETCAYVRSQIAKAGAPPDHVLARDAWQPIYHATSGIPRLINQVCDHALMLACMAQCGQLNGRMIDDAWADLQQLPIPWQPMGGEKPAAAGVVEFGGLALDEDESIERDLPQETPNTAEGPDAMAAGTAPLSETPADFEASFDFAEGLDRAPDSPDELGRVADPCEIAQAAQCQQADVSQTTGQTPGIHASEPVPFSGSNPFDEPFEHEQVVVDRYALLQAVHGADSPAAIKQREIAAAMQTIFENAVQYVEPPDQPATAPAPLPPAAAVAEDIEDQVLHSLAELDLDASHAFEAPASCESSDEDPEEACIPLEMVSEEDESNCVQVVRKLPSDDNDMIVVVDDQRGETPLRSSGGIAHRQEYRQLFSRLRRS
ncbi:MAG: AAA family ATPase [Pirellulaceae bacterium]|nr:AAA family ATPase [Pirellulaceae bacterium]